MAGDFLVMAATLMEIKSRMLLPAEAQLADEEAPDPRRELVRQLLEYRKFKDAAAALEERAERQGRARAAAGAARAGRAGRGAAVRPVELWDLVSAFARLMRETQALAAGHDRGGRHAAARLRGADPERVRAEGRVRVPRRVHAAVLQGAADRHLPGDPGTGPPPRRRAGPARGRGWEIWLVKVEEPPPPGEMELRDKNNRPTGRISSSIRMSRRTSSRHRPPAYRFGSPPR